MKGRKTRKCKHHNIPLTGINVYVRKTDGAKICKLCTREKSKAWYAGLTKKQKTAYREKHAEYAKAYYYKNKAKLKKANSKLKNKKTSKTKKK